MSLRDAFWESAGYVMRDGEPEPLFNEAPLEKQEKKETFFVVDTMQGKFRVPGKGFKFRDIHWNKYRTWRGEDVPDLEKELILVFHKDKMWSKRLPPRNHGVLYFERFCREMEAEFSTEIPEGCVEIKLKGSCDIVCDYNSREYSIEDVVRFKTGKKGLFGSYFDREDWEWVKAVPNKFSKVQPSKGEFWAVERNRSIGNKITVVNLTERLPDVLAYYLSANTCNDRYGSFWKQFYPYG